MAENKLEEKTGKTEIHVVIPNKDDKGYFIYLPETGVKLRSKLKNDVKIIIGYYIPKKELLN